MYTEACRFRNWRSPVLDRHLADKVLRLLNEEKLSQRQVARLTGVSRGTVAAIARGQWHARRRSRPNQESDASSPPSRCPECGAMVTPPCLACRVRAMKARGEVPSLPQDAAGPLQIELHGPYYARYLEVRAAAMARGEGEPQADGNEEPTDDPWADEALWPEELSPSPPGESVQLDLFADQLLQRRAA